MVRTSIARTRAYGASRPPSLARLVLAALFALLLVGMQRETLLHEVDHLRAQVGRGDHAVLETSTPGLCVECALLASGAHPVSGGEAAVRFPVKPYSLPFVALATARAAARPAYYQSRAPPRPV